MWDRRFARCDADARPRCSAGDHSACVTAGDHFAGSGRSADLPQAAAYYRRACEHGVAAGCTALGMLEFDAAGPNPSTSQAAIWLRRGCEGGHLQACSSLAELQLRDGDPARWEEAKQLLQRACEGGHQRACAGIVLWTASVGAEAKCRLAQTAAQAGDALGSLAYGRLQSAGDCGRTDPAAAERLFDRACAGGEGEGCLALARMQLARPPAARTRDRMRSWLELACKQRHGEACVLLADDFLQGNSGPQDPSLARKHLGSACELGVLDACGRFAALLDSAAPPQPAIARAAWEKACSTEAPAPCTGFAVHLLDHPASAADRERALELLERTCSAKYADACLLRADAHGWTGARSTRPQDARAEFERARERSAQGCELGSAAACVNAALIDLNTDPSATGRARASLQRACKQGLKTACNYAELGGPYPFPYPPQQPTPVRFAPYVVPGSSNAELPPGVARPAKPVESPPSMGAAPRPDGAPLPTAAAAQAAASAPAAAPDVTAGHAASPAKAEPSHVQTRAIARADQESLAPPRDNRPLTLDFAFLSTRAVKLGIATFDLCTAIAPRLDFMVRIPMYGASLRLPPEALLAPSRASGFGFGNPEVGVAWTAARANARQHYRAGITLPLAYAVSEQEDPQASSNARSLLEAAAHGGPIENGYLFAHNAVGLVLSANHHVQLRAWRLGVGAAAALLMPSYGRDHSDLFATIQANARVRLAPAWAFGLVATAAGWADASRLRLAFQPRLEQRSDDGTGFGLGLQLGLGLGDDSAVDPATAATVLIQVTP